MITHVSIIASIIFDVFLFSTSDNNRWSILIFKKKHIQLIVMFYDWIWKWDRGNFVKHDVYQWPATSLKKCIFSKILCVLSFWISNHIDVRVTVILNIFKNIYYDGYSTMYASSLNQRFLLCCDPTAPNSTKKRVDKENI